jgi:hypothetical protein
MAVLKAVTKAGLVPKSKRQVLDEDVSAGGSRGTGETNRKSKSKVTDQMLRAAEALGRPVDDPDFVKRLEEAANRTAWNRYR